MSKMSKKKDILDIIFFIVLTKNKNRYNINHQTIKG